MLHEITPLSSPAMHARLLKLGNPLKTLNRMHALIKNICRELNERIAVTSAVAPGVDSVTSMVESIATVSVTEKEYKNEDKKEDKKEEIPPPGVSSSYSRTTLVCSGDNLGDNKQLQVLALSPSPLIYILLTEI